MTPLPALLCMSPGILDRALMGVLVAKDVSLHTHAHLACPYTRWLTHTDAKRYKCQGSVARPEFGFQWLWCDTSRCLCHCQPWEKLQRSRALGQRLMLPKQHVCSGEAQPCMWTCSEKFSAPFTLVMSWVSEALSPSPPPRKHTHIQYAHTHCRTKIAFSLLHGNKTQNKIITTQKASKMILCFPFLCRNLSFLVRSKQHVQGFVFIYTVLFHLFFGFSLPMMFFLSFFLSTFPETIFFASDGIRESLDHNDQTSWNNYNEAAAARDRGPG